MRLVCRSIVFTAALAALMAIVSARAEHPRQELAIRQFVVPSPRAGLEIYVREKHPVGIGHFGPSRTLLFVHGATYPASTSFDLELDGVSWMDYIARHGYDVYLLDLPGYGRSTRPPAMNAAPEDNPPFEDTADAIADYGAVAARIVRERGLERLDLMGWSWGTAIAAGFAAAHPELVNRLVLYAPIWMTRAPPAVSAGLGKLGAYRAVTKEAALKRWLTGVPEDERAGLIPDRWFEHWADATWGTDPVGAKRTPPVLRAPNGVLLDVMRYWREGKPTYDPAKIAAPVLLVQGEWDHDTPPAMSLGLFARLTAARWKQYTELGEGTHHMMMEKNRMQLFRVVQDFLDAPALH